MQLCLPLVGWVCVSYQELVQAVAQPQRFRIQSPRSGLHRGTQTGKAATTIRGCDRAGTRMESALPTEETDDTTEGSSHLAPEDHQQATDGSQDRGQREKGLWSHIEEPEVEQIQSHDYLVCCLKNWRSRAATSR
jgi:hypothetical protein